MQTENLIIICSTNSASLNKIQNKSVVLRTNSLTTIPNAFQIISENNNTLHSILLEPNCTLAELDYSVELPAVNIICFATAIGNYPLFRKQFPALQNRKIVFLFPPTSPQAFTDVKILSTIGLNAGVRLNVEGILWQDLIDLTFQTLYSKAPHIVVEPIQFILSNFRREQDINIGGVYYDNMNNFIFMDDNENFALSNNDLEKKDYIATGFENLESEDAENKYAAKLSAWREIFIKHKMCSICKAYRLCKSKFIATCESGSSEPVEFFEEILSAVKTQQ